MKDDRAVGDATFAAGCTEIALFARFYRAEDYHQRYLERRRAAAG